MKLSPQSARLHKNLGPSKFSSEGFLGTDSRPADEIITEDMRLLARTGYSKELLVKRLKEAYTKARHALGAPVPIRDDVIAVFHESMGRIPSPFRGDGVFEKGEAIVTNTQTGKSIVITRLAIHLIEKHDFFQGKGCRYRIEPQTAVELLCESY